MKTQLEVWKGLVPGEVSRKVSELDTRYVLNTYVNVLLLFFRWPEIPFGPRVRHITGVGNGTAVLPSVWQQANSLMGREGWHR